MMRPIILSVLLCITLLCFGQEEHGDCSKSLILTDLSYKSQEVKGYGDNLEFSGNEIGNELYFNEEHNSFWAVFNAPYDGDLTLTIKGEAEEDWDFLLYEANLTQCQDIVDKNIEPVRTNMARKDKTGLTGLDVTSLNNFASAGINPTMSKWVEVQKDKSYILVIDNADGQNNGFELDIHITEVKKEVHIEEEHMVDETEGFAFADMSEDESSGETLSVTFEVLKEGSDEKVDCHAEIIGVQWDASGLAFEGQSTFTVEVPKDKWFYINVKKEDYTFGTEKYKATEELANEVHRIYISKVAAGEHIVLNEIVFRENTTHMLPTSVNALQQLIDFMDEYPTARIEVQGHVNAPGYDNDGRVKRFSLKRAEQIKEYLVDAGVDGRRIEVAGMGNEFMIYPNPVGYDQEKANRRVEIEILSY